MPSRADSQADERTDSSPRILDHYGLILISIATTYVLASAITSGPARGLVLVAQTATIWLVFRASLSTRPVTIAASVLLLFAGLIAVSDLLGIDEQISDAALFGAASLLYLISPLMIGRHVLRRRTVDVQTLLGAIAAYLLIGMFFAFAFHTIGALESTPFYEPSGNGRMTEDLFFSFTTLMTIGYGNLVPQMWLGQTLAVAEGLIGSLFLVVAVAKVVASWRPAAASSTSDSDRGF